MPWEGPPVDRSRVFRPTENFARVEGLAETVLPLIEKKRFGSALQPILNVLSSDPANEDALRLAILVFSASETSQREASEPLELAQWNDVRLDPIFAECSKCQAVTWVPHLYLVATPEQTHVINPAGMQCHACGYVFCRDCARKHQSIIFSGRTDTEIAEVRCVSCKREKMHPLIYPTGRKRRELRRPGARITQVYLFRAGPVPPDAAYLQELLPVICSQALEDQAAIRVFAQYPWPPRIEDVAKFYVLAAIDRGELPAGSLGNALITRFVDQDRNPGCLVAIAQPHVSEYDEIQRAMAERRFRDAVPLLQKVIRTAPDLAVAHNDLGYARITTGELALAFESLDRSLSLGETPEVYCNLGLAHVIADNVDTAIGMLEKALALRPGFKDAAANLDEARELRARRERRRERWKLAATIPASAHEWASYRGGAMRCAEAKDGPLPPLGLRWQFKADAIIDSSPAVSMGRVYFGTMKGFVHCLDAFSGREYWQAKVAEEGVMSSPAVFEGHVYVGTLDGELCSLDARTGAEHWRFPAGSEVKASPAATASGVLFGSKSGTLYCVDAAGRERWRFAVQGPLLSSVAVLGERMYVSAPGWLYCLSIETAAEVWRQARGFDQGNILALTPAVTQEGVYVAGSNMVDGKAQGYVYCFDPATGRPRWMHEWPSPSPGFQSSPAVAGRMAVIGDMDGVIAAIGNGGCSWLNTNLLEWWILASPAIADDFVYLPVNDGHLHCLSRSTGKSLWKTPLDAETEGSSSSPALAYHRLYVGTSRNGMVCFGEAEE